MSTERDAWKDVLGSPTLVVAPMVDASELAWRLLSRRHGAQLCYTPMLHSCVFMRDARYRNEALVTVPADRPLIAQFCGNHVKTIVQAALLAQPHCDAIDINLGCPQAIAKRGHYGAFLQDDWDLLTRIVSVLRKSLRVPVTCKIRVFEDVDKTVKYAQMLEKAGCSMLTVHGRTRDQKGPLTGIASWAHIKAVKDNVSIPVVANGNIQYLQDVHRCLSETGCDAVMTAEGNLYNPAIFEGQHPPCWELALEYLDLAEQHPCPLSYIRGHLFKLFHHVLGLPENKDLRSDLAARGTVHAFRKVALTLRDRYEPIHEGRSSLTGLLSDKYDLVLPPWLCQPYVRPPPEDYLKKQAQANQHTTMDGNKETPTKRARGDVEENGQMSKKKVKKLARLSKKPEPLRREILLCSRQGCPNPMGLKCNFEVCKVCCRTKCYEDDENCPGHGILIKTRREKARLYNSHLKQDQEPCVANLSEPQAVL